MFKKFIIHFSAFVLATVFVMVGLSKILGHQDFVKILRQSPLIGDFVFLIAYPVPVLEIIVGIALLLPAFRRYGFLASVVLMVVFTAYNIYLIAFAPHVPCGCGGIFRKMSWTTHLYVNISLVILAILGSLFWKATEGNNLKPLWSGALFTFKKRRSVGNQ